MFNPVDHQTHMDVWAHEHYTKKPILICKQHKITKSMTEVL